VRHNGDALSVDLMCRCYWNCIEIFYE